MNVPCPVCQHFLAALKSKAGPYFECKASSDGHLVPFGSLEPLQKAQGLLKALSDHSQPHPPTKLNCPQCKNPLREVGPLDGNDIESEFCPLCQWVWFPFGSLEALVESFFALEEEASPESAAAIEKMELQKEGASSAKAAAHGKKINALFKNVLKWVLFAVLSYWILKMVLKLLRILS